MFHQVFICNNDESVTDIKDQPIAGLTESATLKFEEDELMDEIDANDLDTKMFHQVLICNNDEFVTDIKDQPIAGLTESATLKFEEDELMNEIDVNDLKPPVIKIETNVLKLDNEELDVIDNDTLLEVKQELKREEGLGEPDVTLDPVATEQPEVFKRKECKIKDKTELRNQELLKENQNKFGLINESKSKTDELFNRECNNIEYKNRKRKADNKVEIGRSTIEMMEIPIDESGEDIATKMPLSKSIKNKGAPLLMKVINVNHINEYIIPVNLSPNCNKENRSSGQAIGEEYKYGILCNEGLDNSCSGSKDLGTDPSCGGSKDPDTDSNSSGSMDLDTDSIQNPNNTINQLIPGVEIEVSFNNTTSNSAKKAFVIIGPTETDKINHKAKSKSSSEILHNCKVCNKVFKRNQQLNDHMNIHSKNKPFKCNDCGKEYSSKTALILHSRKGHKTAVSAKETVIQELKVCSRDPNKNTFNNDLFMCKKCQTCFATEKSLKTHVQYTLCGGYKRTRQNQCDICGKSFPGLKKLVAHQITHTNYRPFKCSDCDKHFKCNSALNTHRKSVHEKLVERYLCCYCGIMHTSISHMLAHEQVHSLPEGEEIPKPYKCHECGKCFISKFKLKSHRRQHKLLKCPKCPELFQNRDHRYKHLEKVHNTVKEYKCDICSKVFKNQKSFASHKFVHTTVLSFFCDVCEKGFKKKHHLEQHLITHSDYRPIACPDCDETFKRKTHLKQHTVAVHGVGKKR